MKFLQNENLSRLLTKLNRISIGDRHLHVTLDGFSCKRVNSEKITAGALSTRFDQDCETLLLQNSPDMGPTESCLTDISDLAKESYAGGSPLHMENEDMRRGTSQPLPSTDETGPPQRKRSNSFSSIPLPTAPPSRKRSKSGDVNDVSEDFENGRVAPTTATTTAFGDLADTNVRRLFTDILFTMNSVFPDYDFSDKKAESFKHQNAWGARADINKHFSTSIVQSSSLTEEPIHLQAHTEMDLGTLVPQLWSTIEEIIGSLDECVVFSYSPEMQGDPFHEDGVLWSFNYFFFNAKLKRIMFFTCMARQANLSESLSQEGEGSYSNVETSGDEATFSMDMEESSQSEEVF